MLRFQQVHLLYMIIILFTYLYKKSTNVLSIYYSLILLIIIKHKIDLDSLWISTLANIGEEKTFETH